MEPQNPETWIASLKRDFNITWNVKDGSPKDYYELHYSYFKTGTFMQQLLRVLEKVFSHSPQKPVTWLFTANKNQQTLRGMEVTLIHGANNYEILRKILTNKLISVDQILQSVSTSLPLNIEVDVMRRAQAVQAAQAVQQPPQFIPTEIYMDDCLREKHDTVPGNQFDSTRSKCVSFATLIDVIIDGLPEEDYINIVDRVL